MRTFSTRQPVETRLALARVGNEQPRTRSVVLTRIALARYHLTDSVYKPDQTSLSYFHRQNVFASLCGTMDADLRLGAFVLVGANEDVVN